MSEIVKIATKAIRTMLGRNDTELVLIASPGSSGARVFIFRNQLTGSLYAVKCSQGARISLMEEVARREILVPYLRDHLPEVLRCQIIDGFEVMISECSGIQTLHNLIMNSGTSDRHLFGIWKDVVDTLVHTWLASQHQFQEELCPRYFPARINRISNGLQDVFIAGIKLSKCWQMPVIVNGNRYQSIADSINMITKIGKPKFGVICHGDPQPSNIILTNNSDWYCVDWEWSGSNQDWRMMVSHLYGWWTTRCLVLLTESTFKIIDGCLEINCETVIPKYIKPYKALAKSAALLMSDGSLSKEDAGDINRYLSALYFGELRFLKLWNREQFAPSMLAQAVVTISQLDRDKHQYF